MKKFRLEISIVSILFFFITLLLWGVFKGLFEYLPFVISCLFLVVFILTIFVGRKFKSENGSSYLHEKYAPKYFAKALLSSIVGIAVIIGLAILLNKPRFSTTFDVTQNKVNSLSDASLKFLKSLKSKVNIICIPSPDPNENYCENNANLVDLYARASQEIQNLGQINLTDQELLQSVQPSGFARLVIFTDDNKNEVTGKINEKSLTNAIVNLVKFKKKVYFLSGHGEPSLGRSSNDHSYADFVESLKAKSYESIDWGVNRGDFPKDAQLVVAGSNHIPYGKGVEDILTRFLARGGRLILTVNPFKEQGLEALYSKLGIALAPDILTLDTKSPIGEQVAKQSLGLPPVLVSSFSYQSPITSIIAQSYQSNAIMFVDGARSLKKKERSSVDGLSVNSTDIMDAVAAVSLKVTPSQRNKLDPAKPLFLKSLKASQGSGSYPVAMSVTIDKASLLDPSFKMKDSKNKKDASLDGREANQDSSEVVVFGFSLAGKYSKPGSINSILLPLTVAHLYRDKELIAIPERDNEPKPFNLSMNPGAYVLFFSGLLPLLTAILGLFIWMRRRSA